MTQSEGWLTPHQLVSRLVDLADAGELPDELATTLNHALVRRSIRQLNVTWVDVKAKISEAWRQATAEQPEPEGVAEGRAARVTPLRKEPT